MPINVTRAYRLGKKKNTIEAWIHGEITQTEAAEVIGVRKQNFASMPANILRHMVKDDPEFAKAFDKAFKKY
jgi:DNA-binding XRE family transcriptional regulator